MAVIEKFMAVADTFPTPVRNVFAWAVGEPRVINRMRGFEISAVRKTGTLLTCKDGGKPASVNYYYEVRVRSTGKNPHYKADDKPTLAKMTVGLGTGQGFNGAAHYIPAGGRYKAFVLEEVDSPPAFSEFGGRRIPAQTEVQLCAVSKDRWFFGTTYSMSMSNWSRPLREGMKVVGGKVVPAWS